MEIYKVNPTPIETGEWTPSFLITGKKAELRDKLNAYFVEKKKLKEIDIGPDGDFASRQTSHRNREDRI